MHIHIATIGSNTSNIITCLRALKSVDKVYLIHSINRKHSAEDAKKKIEGWDVVCELIAVSGFDFQEIVNSVYEIYGNYANRKDVHYSMNITGGISIMVAAACSTALFIDAEVYYVMFDRNREDFGQSQGSIEERVIRLPMPKIPNVNGLGAGTRGILEYILDNESDDPLQCSVVADAFGYSKQALKHHTDILKKEGIITVDRLESNNRLTCINLTTEGRMVAGWIKNFNRDDMKVKEIKERKMMVRKKLEQRQVYIW